MRCYSITSKVTVIKHFHKIFRSDSVSEWSTDILFVLWAKMLFIIIAGQNVCLKSKLFFLWFFSFEYILMVERSGSLAFKVNHKIFYFSIHDFHISILFQMSCSISLYHQEDLQLTNENLDMMWNIFLLRKVVVSKSEFINFKVT